jgi:hypothetical protein
MTNEKTTTPVIFGVFVFYVKASVNFYIVTVVSVIQNNARELFSMTL